MVVYIVSPMFLLGVSVCRNTRKNVANNAPRHIRYRDPQNTSCFGASAMVVAIVAGTVSTELGGRDIPAPAIRRASASRSCRLCLDSVGSLIGPDLGADRKFWKAGGLSSISTARSSGGSSSSIVDSSPTSSILSRPLLLASLLRRKLSPSLSLASSPIVPGVRPRSLILLPPPFQLLLMPRPLPLSSVALPSPSLAVSTDSLLASGSVSWLSSSLAMGANVLRDFCKAKKSAVSLSRSSSSSSSRKSSKAL